MRAARSKIRALLWATLTIAGQVSFASTGVADDARRRVIDEACPAFEREDKGANGVMSPREVRCRLAMGESYDEIAVDIQARQTREAEQQRSLAEARAAARERAELKRRTAMSEVPDLCLRLVQEYKADRWLANEGTALNLFRRPDDGPYLDPRIVHEVENMMTALGHRYNEADERAFNLSHTVAEMMQRDGLLNAIAGNMQTRAKRARDYERYRRNAPGPVQTPPSTADYVFACFLQEQFGSLDADPWNRRRP